MAKTESTMLPLGISLPQFSLFDLNGKEVSSETCKNRISVVIFMCNHCPFVIHIREHLVTLIQEYQAKGIFFIGINSNDAQTYPEDSFENMKLFAKEFGYTFPYLYDETQEIAKAFRAACTPDIFVFDRMRLLVYRGQLDDSRPGNEIAVTGKDLRAALDALLAEKPVSSAQRPSIGCNIKWKEGNEPLY